MKSISIARLKRYNFGSRSLSYHVEMKSISIARLKLVVMIESLDVFRRC